MNMGRRRRGLDSNLASMSVKEGKGRGWVLVAVVVW